MPRGAGGPRATEDALRRSRLSNSDDMGTNGMRVDELAEIRAKFSSYIQVLNLLNTNMIRSSQETVLNLLKTYIGDCRSGNREGAAMSCISTGSLEGGAKEAWRSLRKDLQSVGITPELFKIHRQIILSTIQKHWALDGVEDGSIAFLADAESASQADCGLGLLYADPKIPRDWPASRHLYSVNVSEGRESLESWRYSSLNSNMCDQYE
ncbi:hypothetical protein PMG11_06426 [Penicillium brasilianum]|uniref:Uncharacterized protein n=1 Tax=Penicillium brasilianum TaxID=104259 RepID=A0A0F7TM48_PENBI|nr:hypothetical protein PMG11_06426 [Penicillium brasilianum]